MRSEFFLPFFVSSLFFLHLGLGRGDWKGMWTDTSGLGGDSTAYWDQFVVDCLRAFTWVKGVLECAGGYG